MYLYLIPVFIYLILETVPAISLYSRVPHEGTAGWLLLAGDCRLATACRRLAGSPGGALRGPREGSGRLRDGVGRTLR